MAAVTSHARPIGTFPTWRSNSGEHLSQPLGCLDESGDGYRQCNTEKSLRASPERAAGQRHDADVLERALLERRGGEALRQWDPEIHRRARAFDLESVGLERREDRVAPLLELRGVSRGDALRLLEHFGARRLHREEGAGVHVVLHAGHCPDPIGTTYGPPQPPS